ncbi:MAG: FAD-dependent oxidoreductase [Halovenus sp.]
MRVAVLGAGYAGLTVACRLERTLPDDVELVVVDESSDHVVQHELHRLVRYPELSDVISVPLDDILTSARIEQATVTDIDTEAGVATLEDDGETETLEYDYAAVCLGAETEFYGLTDVEQYATPLKRIEHAREIRADALAASGGDAVVGGAGLSGIQTAGELAELATEEELDLDVTIVEMADQVAPGFDATFAGAIRRELEVRDVTVETGVAIESADESVVHLEDGRSLSAEVFVWTGGIRGPASLGGDRLATAGDLRVSDSTFVVGDAANVTDEADRVVPASAQSAIREGGVAAENILKLVGETGTESGTVTIPVTGQDGEDSQSEAAEPDESAETSLTQYSYSSPGWVVSVGNGAVAKVGPVVFSGEPAKATKAGIGAGHLGSVGAISKASQLVAEELGWPTTDSLGITEYLDNRGVLGNDPGRPSELGEPFVRFLQGVSDVLGEDRTIDVTRVTQEGDPDYPGSAMNRLQRFLFDTAGPTETTDGESVEITIEDESEDRSDDDGDAEADGTDDPRADQ